MLITHGRLITFGETNEIIEDGALYIEGDRIADIGPTRALKARYPEAEELNADGQLVMPGLICAHTHFYGAFARGMALVGEPPRTFPEILGRLWWPLDRSLRDLDVRYSTLVCLADAIRHGTTTLIDHHASPYAVHGALDQIADAVEEAGVRACLCYEVSDRDGPDRAQEGIDENVRFIRRVQQGEASPLLAATFGLHASLTLSDETLAECAAAGAELGVGFHIHVAEDLADQEDSLRKSGKRVVERLQAAGILGPQTVAAHAVHVDAWEMAILRETGTWVSHQPRSNMNNGVGVADVPTMLRGGVRVVLGNDGFSNNMFTEMKTAYLVHKLHRRDPRVMPADQVLEVAVANNARLARLFWPAAPLGELSVGAYADVIFVDYHPYTPLTPGNLPWHIIFGVDGSHVTTTIVGGQVLMRDRELLTLDEAAIAARARELAPAVWERYRQQF
ncbi:MAG TPA: putative aminohydrolase SsnA [Chloroflexi bacterium]|nr:putative aminohydrolase SsnA [Chloroflexota bacterium]